MKESLWGYLILILGIIVTVVILLVSRVTSHAEEDYYLAREVLQASLIDAIDYGTYRTTGRVVISKDLFKEIYIRRFAESVTNSQNYIIEFYDIYEEPPKASVRIRTESGVATVNNNSTNFSIDTLLTGILETDFEQYISYTEDPKDKDSVIEYETNEYTYFLSLYITDNVPKNEVYTNLELNKEFTDESLIKGTRVVKLLDSNNSACNHEKNQKTYCKVYYNGTQLYINQKYLTDKVTTNNISTSMKSKYCTIEKSNVDTSKIFKDEENKILNELNLYNNSEIKNYVNNIDDIIKDIKENKVISNDYINKINNTLLLILNHGDVEVNELGTIAVYFSLDDYSLYSNLSTGDIYNIKLENKLESNSITMPIKTGYSCTYEYNGTPVFDERGKLNARSYVVLKKNINKKYLILNLTCK